MKRWRIIAGVGLVLALGAVGVVALTGESEADKQARAKAVERERAKRKALADYRDCRRLQKGLLDELAELDSRLDIGLSYVNYSEKVADVRVAYDRIEFEELELECVSRVGVHAETALNEYTKAVSRWGDCIESPSCSVDDDAQPAMQKRWSRAGRLRRKAERGLDKIKGGTDD